MTINHPLAVVGSRDGDTPRTMSDMDPLGHYTPAATARTYARPVVGVHAPRWAELVDQWRPWLEAESMSTGPDGTVGLRTYHVMRAAQETTSPPETITADELVGFMTAHEWAPNTRRSYRASLRKFFTWMAGRGLRADNPGLLIPKTPIPRKVARPCPMAAIERALAAANVEPKVALSIRLGAQLGLRRGEIATVHANHVEQHNGGWWLRVIGKGGHQRLVPCPADLAAQIRALPGWLWFNCYDPSKHVRPDTVGKKLTEVLNRNTELGHIVPHQLRHRFATQAYMAGTDLPSVQRLLGHAKIETTMAYVEVPQDNLVAAAQGAWF